MDTVDPTIIIEEQLRFLAARSKNSLLTETEVQSLTALVKLQIVLRAKALSERAGQDEFDELSAEELKALIPLLNHD